MGAAYDAATGYGEVSLYANELTGAVLYAVCTQGNVTGNPSRV